jgi:hypothetical protein
MTKAEFKTRFFKAIAFCREFSDQVRQEELPQTIRISFPIRDWGPTHKGKCKVWGGRLLDSSNLENVEPEDAWKYLWVDGKIPHWINVYYDGHNEAALTLVIRACSHVTDNDEALYHAREGNPPFHILCRCPSERTGG